MDWKTKHGCIIHTSDEDLHSDLISPRYSESWYTLLKAARLRGETTLEQAGETTKEGKVPEMYYHGTKWTKTREPLIKCVELQAGTKVRDVRIQRYSP